MYLWLVSHVHTLIYCSILSCRFVLITTSTVFVLFAWVETRGLTLEEVDRLFDENKRELIVEQIKEEIGVDVDAKRSVPVHAEVEGSNVQPTKMS